MSKVYEPSVIFRRFYVILDFMVTSIPLPTFNYIIHAPQQFNNFEVAFCDLNCSLLYLSFLSCAYCVCVTNKQILKNLNIFFRYAISTIIGNGKTAVEFPDGEERRKYIPLTHIDEVILKTFPFQHKWLY